ncbi:MAG: hypothetical protein V9G12_00020 [Microthrixaceae bacterium]
MNTAINVAMNVQVAGSTVPGSFATLVYEPYNQSGGNAGIVPDTWQQWDTLATSPGDGEWWTTKIGSGPGSQGDPQPWSFFVDLYTDGQVVGYGIQPRLQQPEHDHRCRRRDVQIDDHRLRRFRTLERDNEGEAGWTGLTPHVVRA